MHGSIEVERGSHLIQDGDGLAIGPAGGSHQSMEQVTANVCPSPPKIKKFTLGSKTYELGVSRLGSPEWRLI